MKRKINTNINRCLTILALLLLAAGLAMIQYPNVCQHLYKRKAEQIISDYQDRLDEYTRPQPESGGGEWDWLYEMIVQYNEELYENGQSSLVDAFSYQQVGFGLVRFGFDEEMIGYLSIPKMGIELPIYLGANRENMANGAAHLTQTSLPVGGINTNAVFAAHRGMSTAAMFRNIEELEAGDEVLVTNFRETLTYRVAETVVIDPADIDAILIQKDRDLVTLITCHPYRYNYQRYVVYCERVTETGNESDESGEKNGERNGQAVVTGLRTIFRYAEMSKSQQRIFLEYWIPVGITVLLIILAAVLLVFKRKKVKKCTEL